MPAMTKEEIIEVFETYLNNKGLWWDFVKWVNDESGYTIKEIGFTEED